MAGTRPSARLLAKLRERLRWEARPQIELEAERLRHEMACEKSKNERVAELSGDHGDALDQARPVQHWAYFPTEVSRAQFISFIQQRFSKIDSYKNPLSVDKEYAVSFWHTGLVDSDSMTEVTKTLSLAAESCGGEYDGWETQVVQ